MKDDKVRLVDNSRVLRNLVNAAVRFNWTRSRIESRTPLQYVKYASDSSSSYAHAHTAQYTILL